MKKIFLILLSVTLFHVSSAKADSNQNQQKFQQQVQNFIEQENLLKQKIYAFKEKQKSERNLMDECPPIIVNPPKGEYRCVANCLYRDSSGTCGVYGSDFCGENANCSENCLYRDSSGTCGVYGGDICY